MSYIILRHANCMYCCTGMIDLGIQHLADTANTLSRLLIFILIKQLYMALKSDS